LRTPGWPALEPHAPIRAACPYRLPVRGGRAGGQAGHPRGGRAGKRGLM